MALREDLRSSRFLEGAGLSLTVSGSFGLATYPEDGNTVPTILRRRRHHDVRSQSDALIT